MRRRDPERQRSPPVDSYPAKQPRRNGQHPQKGGPLKRLITPSSLPLPFLHILLRHQRGPIHFNAHRSHPHQRNPDLLPIPQWHPDAGANPLPLDRKAGVPSAPPIAANNALQDAGRPLRQQQTEHHKRTDQRWHAGHKLNDAPVPSTQQPQSSQPSRGQSRAPRRQRPSRYRRRLLEHGHIRRHPVPE